MNLVILTIISGKLYATRGNGSAYILPIEVMEKLDKDHLLQDVKYPTKTPVRVMLVDELYFNSVMMFEAVASVIKEDYEG